MVNKIKLYLSKGKVKLALEMVLQIPKNLIDSELRTDALLNLSRYVSLEEKLLKGIISLENAEITENQIKLSSIQLLGNYEFPELPISLKHDSSKYSILGKWVCEYFDPNLQQRIKLIWELSSNNTYSEEFRYLNNTFIGKILGTWHLLNENIYQAKDTNGLEGEGLIEWLDYDKIIFTILSNNGKNIAYENLKKIYSRID